MNLISKIVIATLLLVSACSHTAFCQEEDDTNKKSGNGKLKPGKGFHVGLFVGSLFANNASARVYDGYGMDPDGFRNDFQNSFMNQKIVFQYGGYGPTTTPDYIKDALSVNGQSVTHDGWSFTESDMPLKMRYIPSVMLGVACRYFVDKKNSLILNVNATKLKVNGGFTITLTNPIYANTAYQQFTIIGGEQRLLFQLGYQRILGNNEKANLFVEGGINTSMVKFDKNEIAINNLVIDLTTYYNPYGNVTGLGFRRPVSVNLGAFGGLGINLTMSDKWTIQLLYGVIYERLKLGYDAGLRLQHSVGLRAYYNL